MTKEKCTGFPERYQVWEGCLSDLPGRKASSRPELYAPGTLIPSGICKYPILSPQSLQEHTLKGPILRPWQTQIQPFGPDLKHLAI
ncbi:MAG: hypothetical protein ACYDEF_01255 [Methanosarcina sp.]|nr:hypothetical protein BGV40_05585 [Methanosarcina sp. Ant1]